MKRSWTFGEKIAAGFAVVVLLSLAVAAVGYYTLHAVVESKNQVILHTDEDLLDAERLRASMQREAANLRGFLLTNDARFPEGLKQANEQFETHLGRIKSRGASAMAQAQIAGIAAARAAHRPELDQIVRMRRSQDDVAALVASWDKHVIPKFDVLADKVREFVASTQQAREVELRHAADVVSRARMILVSVAIATLLLAVGIATWLARTLSLQIGASVQHIRSASGELQAAATQQASGAKEQATAMNEITTTIGELLASSRQIAESGQHVAKMASESARSARDGEQSVTKAREAVGGIQQQVDKIVQHMLGLGKKSQQIGGIVEIINELSEQTNILAINATIEAAGAGEAGRRFSVVGEEIRKLADRVGGSTKEVRMLIEAIRSAVNATVMATEAGSKTVEAGAQRFEELQSAFSRIGSIVASTMEAGREIELSTKQQSTAVEQVNIAISDVAQTTQETEAGSRQTLQTASQLASLSDALARLVQAQQS